MSFPIQTLVVNEAEEKHTIGPLDAQVRLVNPDGTPFATGSADAIADKLTAGGVEPVTGTTVADVKDMLNKLIAALTA
ncbi:hypothetical protein [Bifidobacterium dentium]|uniref:hypothetical protein n=1 Tax=Bifidobacterium dentium TaxID=1689 RepID=UPI0018B0A113|nr:hypothetical protein [Bifidobacterium dentium]MBF9694108.1 hypothetical protein [Bifidobacterium dentium]